MKTKDIMPFHLFQHRGHHYMINIENMTAASIDQLTTQALEEVLLNRYEVLSPKLYQLLDELQLIDPIDKEAKKTQKNKPYPITNIALFLTQSCNLKCVYCYGDGGNYGSGGHMDRNTAFRTVDWLMEQSGKNKIIHIGFFGGEPFLQYPLMVDIVEYAKARGNERGKQVGFQCTTNGTLLEDEQIAFIKEHHISVMVSFDGPHQIQDAQRPYANGNNSYAAIVPKIQNLLKVLPETPGHAVLVGKTDPQIVKDALKEIGFKNISIEIASQSLFQENSSTIPSERNIQGLLNTLEQEAENWITLTKSRNKEALRELLLSSRLYTGIVSLLHHNKKRYPCGAGLGMVGVSVSGEVYPCHRFVGTDYYKLGSIFDNELKRESYQINPALSNPICSICFAKYYCAGGCKHDHLGACGSIDTPAADVCLLKCREFQLAASVTSRLTPEDHDFLVDLQIIPTKPCPFDF